MTDRELLELAVKADGELYFEHAPEGGLYRSNGLSWNPLTNDGDALRLAVKLRFDLMLYSNVKGVFTKGVQCSEDGANDPYAATRRAIVRAAAAIGKARNT
jgi:hypothetical protein